MHWPYLNFTGFSPKVLSPIQDTTSHLVIMSLRPLPICESSPDFLCFSWLWIPFMLALYLHIYRFIQLTHQLTHGVSGPMPGTESSEMHQGRPLISRSSQRRRLARSRPQNQCDKRHSREGTGDKSRAHEHEWKDWSPALKHRAASRKMGHPQGHLWCMYKDLGQWGIIADRQETQEHPLTVMHKPHVW